MNNIQVFNNTDFGEVRVIEQNGEPWFVANDVCRALEIKNARDAVSRIDDDEKGVVLTDTLGGKQQVAIVNEPGLYSLVLSSRKPEAKAFKRWITHEIIPAIRKHGAYATPETIEQILGNPDFGIRVLTELKAEQELRRKAETEIAELTPKAAYYDTALHSKSVIAISKIAKEYGMSAKRFNKLLNSLGIQYKQGECWLLYQKYAACGYTQLQTHVIDANKSKNGLYWTQKGRQFLYEFLKERGIMPITEGDYDEQE